MSAQTDSIPSVQIPATYLRENVCAYDSLWQSAPDSNRIMGNNPLYKLFPAQEQEGTELPELNEVSATTMYGYRTTLNVPPHSTHTIGVGIPRRQPLGNALSYLPYMAILLLALLLVYYTRSYLRMLFVPLISFKSAHKLYKSNMQNVTRVLHILTWFSLIPAGILIGSILHLFPSHLVPTSSIQVYLIAAAGIIVFATIKNLILYAAGILTFSQPIMQELRYNSRIFIGLWGIVTFPMVLLLSLNIDDENATSLLAITVALSLLFFILYLLRTLQLFLSEKISLFFWFLYLCTLELLPALLVFDHLFPIR